MKIGMVAQPWDEVRPPGQGGTSVGIVASELAHRLASANSVTVYGKRFGGQDESATGEGGVVHRRYSVKLERYLHRGIEVIEPDIDRGWFKLPYFASARYFRRYAERIARDLANDGCEIAHVHNFSQYLPLIRARSPRIRLVLHMHCGWLVELDRSVIERRLQHADLIIGPSDYVTEGVRRRFPELAARCTTLYNGVDLDHFSPEPEARSSDAVPRVLYVSRVSPEKGVHVLLEAFERVLRAMPEARLDIYGPIVQIPYNFCAGLSDQPEVRALKRFYRGGPMNRMGLARQHAHYLVEMQGRHAGIVGSSVVFRGPRSHADLLGAYRGADLLVFPSVCMEAFGMSLAEAMACRLPIVAARAGGITDVVERIGAGVVVERDDPAGLAEAITALLRDPERRRVMGERGRQFATTELAWDHLASQLQQHYDELLGEPAAHAA